MSDLVFSLITSSPKIPTIVTKKQYQLSWESRRIRGDYSVHSIAVWQLPLFATDVEIIYKEVWLELFEAVE